MDKAACNLLGLLHAPPWKPWLLAGKIGGGDSFRKIGKHLSGGRVLEDAEQYRVADVDEGAKHSLLILLQLKRALEERLQDHKELLEDYASLIDDVLKSIREQDDCYQRVMEAGDLASSLNRILVKEAFENEGLGDAYPDTVMFINVFAPKHVVKGEVIDPPGGLGPDTIASFIKEYTDTVADAIAAMADRLEGEEPGRRRQWLVHIAYLLLEPIWYKSTSLVKLDANGRLTVERLLVPPSDLRVPIHTVFDYVNSVLAMLLLMDGGCLSIVDLAGVQGFIDESRRMRDLWAASWLASFLSWKAVEGLVLDYGPGVLLLPPGRLHAFYSAKIMGEYLDSGTAEDWLYPALGIPPDFKWPALATIPSLSYIVLPREACENGRHRKVIEESYREAWRRILEKVVDKVKEELKEIGACNGEVKGAHSIFCEESGAELVRRLEPPQALRIYTVRYENLRGEGESSQEKAVQYDVLLAKLNNIQNKVKISAPGRGTGENYYDYVSKQYRDGYTKLCTVCGKAPAVIDGEELGEISEKKDKPSDLVSVEVQDERLCPYCLVKRMLRKILKEDKAISRDLVGMDATTSGNQEKLPRWDSVTDSTTRLSFALNDNCKGRELLMEKLAGALAEIIDKLDLESVKWHRLGVREPKDLDTLRRRVKDLLRNEEMKELVESTFFELLLYTVLESLITKSFLEDLKEKGIIGKDLADMIEDLARELQSIPRRYAVLAADGDKMGSGLLRVRLPLSALEDTYSEEIASPRRYLAKIGEALRSGGVREEIAKVVREKAAHLLAVTLRYVGGRYGSLYGYGERTTYVYPSYHYTVSRSLILMSQLDARVIGRAGGQLIYAGGDDVLAIVPPASACKNNSAVELILNALEAAEGLRRNWWGEQGEVEGLNGFLILLHKYGSEKEQDESSGKGKGAMVLHFAPAPAAYGRSMALLLADALYPMWLTLSTTRMLEDLKDDFIQEGPGGTAREKDLLMIASDSRGLSYTTLLPLRGVAAGTIAAVIRLIKLIYTEGVLSNSVLYDIPANYMDILSTTSTGGYMYVHKRVLTRAVERNIPPGKGVKAEDLLSYLTRSMFRESDPDKRLDYSLMIRLANPARKISHQLSFYTENPYIKDRDAINLILSVFAAAHVYTSALPSPGIYNRLASGGS